MKLGEIEKKEVLPKENFEFFFGRGGGWGLKHVVSRQMMIQGKMFNDRSKAPITAPFNC